MAEIETERNVGGNFLDKLKGLFKGKAEKVKENLLGTPKTPEPVKPTNICFFEGDPIKKEYMRVFATLLSLEPHKLVVRINGEEFAYPCRYDLTRPMDRIGDILLFYAYAHPDQDVELYPLPVGSAEFNIETAGTMNFPRISDKERLDLIYAIPGVKEAEAEIARVQDSFLSGVRDVLDFAASQTRLGKYLPSLQTLLGKGLDLAYGGTSTPQTAEVGRVAVDIQPAREEPSSKVNVLSSKEQKKLGKELTRDDKQRDKYIRSLFRKK